MAIVLESGAEDLKTEGDSYEIFCDIKDYEKVKKALEENDAKYEEWIKADIQLGGKIGVRGTPTFYLNGRKTGARTLDAYKKEIDAILNKKE